MNTDPRLETYLSRLDRVLTPFPAGDRAEIVTEIKSHVLSAMERDPKAELNTILSAFGEPELVANRYLMERGLKPVKPPVSPVVKWLVIGFLGTVALVLLFIGIAIAKFSPLVRLDDSGIRLMGGLVDLSDDGITIGGSVIDNEGTQSLKGLWQPATLDQTFLVKFGAGKIHLSNSDNEKLAWACKGKAEQPASQPQTSGNQTTLDLSNGKMKCDFQIPKNLNFSLIGVYGKVTVEEPHFHLALTLGNGKVALDPDKQVNYNYTLSVANGKMGEFISSPDPKAYKISVNLTNGKISRTEDDEK